VENQGQAEHGIVSDLLAVAGIAAPEEEVLLLARHYGAHRAALTRLSSISAADDKATASGDC
jgi:hypothetical protein